jgi:hypothetical protein
MARSSRAPSAATQEAPRPRLYVAQHALQNVFPAPFAGRARRPSIVSKRARSEFAKLPAGVDVFENRGDERPLEDLSPEAAAAT